MFFSLGIFILLVLTPVVVCRSYDVKPSQNDLVDHIDLIAEATKRDVNLEKSKVSRDDLLTFWSVRCLI